MLGWWVGSGTSTFQGSLLIWLPLPSLLGLPYCLIDSSAWPNLGRADEIMSSHPDN